MYDELPEMGQQVLAHGKAEDICAYLKCSRTTLWRRMKDMPEKFIRIGRGNILLVIPRQQAAQLQPTV